MFDKHFGWSWTVCHEGSTCYQTDRVLGSTHWEFKANECQVVLLHVHHTQMCYFLMSEWKQNQECLALIVKGRVYITDNILRINTLTVSCFIHWKPNCSLLEIIVECMKNHKKQLCTLNGQFQAIAYALNKDKAITASNQRWHQSSDLRIIYDSVF